MKRISASTLMLVTLRAAAGIVDVDYQVSETAYALRDISASGTEVVLGDDEVGGPYPVGFGFNFYGEIYTQAFISSNGFITFNPGSSSGCCMGLPIPTPGGVDNLVAGFWEDLNPPGGGTIRYQTLGVPPNREFVVGFYQVRHFRGNTPVEMEIILHETSNLVELQYTTATTDGEGDHSVGVESAGGQFGTQVDFGTGFSYSQEGRLLTPDGGNGDPAVSRATFAVDKLFSDANPAEVEVTLSCNTGLPLQQTAAIAGGDGVVFVVTDFEDGALSCSLSEVPVPAGYAALYSTDGGFSFPSAESCVYDEVAFGDANSCLIFNDLELVLVEVTKLWLDENPQFSAPNFAEALFECEGEQYGIPAFGTLEFVGDGAVDGFFVFPHWNGTTRCEVSELTMENGVEADDSECQDLQLVPGEGASCNLYNTRLYEGIPALDARGLAVMVLLVLGLGLSGLRARL